MPRWRAEPIVHLPRERRHNLGRFRDGTAVARVGDPGIERSAQAQQGFAVLGGGGTGEVMDLDGIDHGEERLPWAERDPDNVPPGR